MSTDDVEAVVHVARIATEFRQKFNTDVLDMICYRRFGHNEGDEPAFTQPRMYKAIRNHPSVRQIYGDQLVSEGVMTAGEAKAIIDDNLSYLEKEFEAGTGYRPNKADWLEGSWSGFRTAHGEARRGDTSVTQDEIASVATAMTTVPEGLSINSNCSGSSMAAARRSMQVRGLTGRPPNSWLLAHC